MDDREPACLLARIDTRRGRILVGRLTEPIPAGQMVVIHRGESGRLELAPVADAGTGQTLETLRQLSAELPEIDGFGSVISPGLVQP